MRNFAKKFSHVALDRHFVLSVVKTGHLIEEFVFINRRIICKYGIYSSKFWLRKMAQLTSFFLSENLSKHSNFFLCIS
jgi:hypothetical protein